MNSINKCTEICSDMYILHVVRIDDGRALWVCCQHAAEWSAAENWWALSLYYRARRSTAVRSLSKFTLLFYCLERDRGSGVKKQWFVSLVSWIGYYIYIFIRQKGSRNKWKKHQAHNNKKQTNKTTVKAGELVNSVTTFIYVRTQKNIPALT